MEADILPRVADGRLIFYQEYLMKADILPRVPDAGGYFTLSTCWRLIFYLEYLMEADILLRVPVGS
jgi:hypothetical protein